MKHTLAPLPEGYEWIYIKSAVNINYDYFSIRKIDSDDDWLERVIYPSALSWSPRKIARESRRVVKKRIQNVGNYPPEVGEYRIIVPEFSWSKYLNAFLPNAEQDEEEV